MKLRPCSLGPSIGLNEAKTLVRNFADESKLPEKITSIELGVSGPISKWNTKFIFDYAIFPSSIMKFDAEWEKLARPMAVGDVIVQRAVLPPIGFGLCMEFAVRICSVMQSETRRGFAYETLAGHAESGVSEFYFEDREGELHFTIHTLSKPGHWTSRFAARLITLPYQAWCTRRALENVARRFRMENKLVANQSADPAP